jgi:phosphatidylserine/phosphatidylglycerophosphate/cardiolipin synthase-like enzyme
MGIVNVRPYLSPTLVLLALDWPDGSGHADFLGFAIQRTPGFQGAASSWLPNRLTFTGPNPDAGDLPSNENPIQSFLWWDARFSATDRGSQFTYKVIPVTGAPGALTLVDAAASSVTVTIPQTVEQGIGTYFNRAVVSSQAFSKEFPNLNSETVMDQALAWLANGMQDVVPAFLSGSDAVEGAIYHLTDQHWILPAFHSFGKPASLVYDARVTHHRDGTVEASPNQVALDDLSDTDVKMLPRTKTNIMHDKFLVRVENGQAAALLAGSANYTTEGLTSQANLMHTFESPALADLYLQRKRLIADDPTVKATAEGAAWSAPAVVGDATVRVFYSPEPTGQRASIDTIVQAVQNATNSVIFCLFDPTDAALMSAIFSAGDAGKMMFGLVNSISASSPDAASGEGVSKKNQIAVTLYDRSRDKQDTVSHSAFNRNDLPTNFLPEISVLPGSKEPVPVYIHHKFIVIDAETDHPVIYSGSANMSENSIHHNDENLLEIAQCPRLAAIYLAEFMRLYDHYRSRFAWNNLQSGRRTTFQLAADASWARAAFTAGTPEFKSRTSMVAAP